MKVTRLGIREASPGPKQWVFLALTVSVLFTCIGPTYAGGGPNVTGAKLYIQQDDLPKAIEVLTKELNEVNDKNEDAWYLLGYIYARQKKYDEMLKHFDKAVELKPKFKEKGIKIGRDTGTQFHAQHGVEKILGVVWANAFNSGVQNFNAGVNATDDESRKASYEQAVDDFRIAAIIRPDSVLTYRNWAAALMNAGRSEESVEPLNKALEVDPGNADIKKMLSQIYLNAGKDSLALPILEDMWESGARDEEVADYLSRIYVGNNQIDKANNIYKIALESNPDSYHFRYNYGTILLEAEQFDEAIAQLQKAYEIDPESSDINYNLGACYLNRGVKTREELPNDSEDKSYLKDFERAFPYLEKAIKMNPRDGSAWMTLGRIAGQLNKIVLAGYSFAKGDPIESAVDEKVMIGMPTETLTSILGKPDAVKPIDSEQFAGIEEWSYTERKAGGGKIGIPEPLKIYVVDGLIDALLVEN